MEITTAMEVITPVMAKTYLDMNIGCNRRVHPKMVSKYARDMKNGQFLTTHQGIAFDTEGRLIDGQHRLFAVLLSDTPMTCLVTRNVPRDAIAFVDRGTSRTMSDSLTITNPGSSEISRILKHPAVPSVLRQLIVCSYKNMSVSVSEITKVFNMFQEQFIQLFRITSAKHNGVNRCQLLSSAIAAMYHGVTAEQIERFFQVFRKADITGCAGYNVNAALDWRHQIDEAKYKGSRIPGDKIFLGTQNAIWHFVNNTDVKHIVVTNTPRYDVSEQIKSVFC